VKVLLVRHGETPGNALRRYIGRTDEPLSAQGAEKARAAGGDARLRRVFVTPLRRTQQTAEILFPNAGQTVVDGLREMDFGDFEGRSADEMAEDAAYRAWVEAECEPRCPGGEAKAEFSARVVEAFTRTALQELCAGAALAVFVVHGGTIMSILSALSRGGESYYSWATHNCGAFLCSVVPAQPGEAGPIRLEEITRLDAVPALTPRESDYSFFQNRACRYFPCHEGADPEKFNCLFCYCPLYALGEGCGGNFEYTAKGSKSCLHCLRPHGPEALALIQREYPKIMALAKKKES